MKTLAFTFVQNDLVGLRLWLSYYTRYFDDLNVYCFNTKEEHRKDLDELKREYNFVYEFLYEYEGNKIDGTPAVLLGFIKDIQNTFLGDHDWILCCNLDEIFISKRGNLKDLMEKHKNELVALPSEGYDVIQAEDEKPIDYSKPLFEQRKYMVKNPNYNKIVLTRVPLNWVAGLHKIDSMTDDESRAIFEELAKKHHVGWYLDKTMPDPGECDFLLFWSSSNEDYFGLLDKYKEPKGLCL